MSNGDQATALERSGQSADENMSSAPAGSVTQHCGNEKTWIEIQLVGEDDLPIAGEKYRIELPDGRSQEGVLDAEGTASIEGIDPGLCAITFPDLDQAAWEPL